MIVDILCGAQFWIYLSTLLQVLIHTGVRLRHFIDGSLSDRKCVVSGSYDATIESGRTSGAELVPAMQDITVISGQWRFLLMARAFFRSGTDQFEFGM